MLFQFNWIFLVFAPCISFSHTHPTPFQTNSKDSGMRVCSHSSAHFGTALGATQSIWFRTSARFHWIQSLFASTLNMRHRTRCVIENNYAKPNDISNEIGQDSPVQWHFIREQWRPEQLPSGFLPTSLLGIVAGSVKCRNSRILPTIAETSSTRHFCVLSQAENRCHLQLSN